MGRIPRLLLAVLLALPGLAAADAGDDPCAAFTWDVKNERSLFAQAPQLLAAGRAASSAPQLRPGRLYELQLATQGEVHFALAPERAHSGYAGLLRFSVPAAGRYRVALSDATWVDVIAGKELIGARDFQGRHGCSAPHKVLEFELPARKPLLLQLSGARAASVRVGLSRAP